MSLKKVIVVCYFRPQIFQPAISKARHAMHVHCGAFLQPLLQWKSNNYYISWVCVCTRTCPACDARAPYCHLWSARLYNIFLHCLTTGTIVEKNGVNKMCFELPYDLSETFLILRRTVWDIIHISFDVLLLSIGLPVANALDVLQPCVLLYCP
jgi:hypothetical protein